MVLERSFGSQEGVGWLGLGWDGFCFFSSPLVCEVACCGDAVGSSRFDLEWLLVHLFMNFGLFSAES